MTFTTTRPLAPATTSGLVCAHCGGWSLRDGEKNHLCMAALLDWAEADGMGLKPGVTLCEWLDYAEAVVKMAD